MRLGKRVTGSLHHDVTVEGIPSKDVKMSSAHVSGSKDVLSAHAPPKQEAKVRFTPTEKGVYEFYCAETAHKEGGMRSWRCLESM